MKTFVTLELTYVHYLRAKTKFSEIFAGRMDKSYILYEEFYYL